MLWHALLEMPSFYEVWFERSDPSVRPDLMTYADFTFRWTPLEELFHPILILEATVVQGEIARRQKLFPVRVFVRAGNPGFTAGRDFNPAGGAPGDCGSLRQSGPRPDPRLLRHAALEALTRSARTDSPRRIGRKQISGDDRRRRRVGGGGGGVREAWRGRLASRFRVML
ncbi:hypothetical protein F511_41917 [Dorcoceras hygrometricum]|uniref:Uncharacterized protein n=1 Tax=Dorcoceras hygrometricum TaxID=472368 RepID=A0A2Z7B848_9LAMI|nr:hypothetical protein F511_41917 [Dorcoceras hygrometricum]